MIKELLTTDGKLELIEMRVVAVKPYGSCGCIPIYADDCMYKGIESCISGSGDSVCGGYYGHAGKHVVRCQENAHGVGDET
jgi:hypothetical protein